MFSKSILTFLILVSLTLAKVNGFVENNYTGKCNDTYVYLEGQGKIENFIDCKMNDKGEVIELQLYGYCFENEELETVLSYKTIETLEFKWFNCYQQLTDEILISQFGCASPPTNYTVLSTLTNLKYLNLIGLKNADDNTIANIPKSVEVLNIGSVLIPEPDGVMDELFQYIPSKDFELTQKMIDTISKLSNLTSLGIYNTIISDKLNFSKFKNLKNLTSLLLNYDETDYSNPIRNIQKNMFKYFKYLKKLVIVDGIFNQESFDTISYLTNLEELSFDRLELEYGTKDVSFYSLRKLKNLTYLYIQNYMEYNLLDIFYLTSLKKLIKFSEGYEDPMSTSKDKSITWANLKNLEYLKLVNYEFKDILEEFDLKYLGDLPNLKEVYLMGTGYSSIPESIGNLKNLEVLGVPFCHLDSIPKSIGNLKKLRILDVTYNDLTSIPEEIGNIKNLLVYLDYNDLENPPNFIKFFGESYEDEWFDMYNRE